MFKFEIDKSLKIAQLLFFTLIIGYFVLKIIYYFSDIITLLITAGLVAFLSNELITPMVKRKVSISGAIAIVYTTFICTIILAIILLLPTLLEQLTQLLNDLPSYISNLENTLRKLIKPIEKFGLRVNIEKFVLTMINSFENSIYRATKNFPGLIVGGFSAFINFVIVIVVSIYLVRDFKKTWDYYIQKMGNSGLKWEYFRKELVRNLKGFVKGQIFSGIFMMVITIIIYSIIGLNFGIVAGFFLGIMEIIPYFGTFIGYIPLILISLSQSFQMFLITIFVTLIIQQIKDNVLFPRWVGETVGIHPLVIIISIIIGSKIAGFLGIFLAIPVAGFIQALIKAITTENIQSDNFNK